MKPQINTEISTAEQAEIPENNNFLISLISLWLIFSVKSCGYILWFEERI